MRDYQSGSQLLHDINNRTVDITGLEPPVVVAGLLNARRGDGLTVPGQATPESVWDSFEAYRRLSIDGTDSIWDRAFLESLGLELKLSVSGSALHTFHYDNAYGDGLSQIVIDHIRCTSGEERWRTDHLIYYARPASLMKCVLTIGMIAVLLAFLIVIAPYFR